MPVRRARGPGADGPGRSVPAHLPLAAALLLLGTASGCAQTGPAPFPTGAGAATPPLAILPLTRIGPGGAGYLADPQPVHLASPGNVQVLSGTTRAIITGAYPIRPDSFSWTPVTVNAAGLRGRIAAAGATITNFQNLDLYQDNAGSWHAAVTIGVRAPSHPRYWTVVAHAHPVGPAGPGTVPLAWSADAVLSGSFSDPVQGNYDAKYIEDGGRLYLLYVRNVAPEPALRNVIALLPLRSPSEPEAVAPATLLAPGDRFGPLASENYDRTPAKLVEAPFLSRVGGKYALVYSTGAYLTPGYKAGVAWSDTLLPPAGGSYRKVLEADPADIWGEGRRPEVRYLLQSQRPRWPHFTGDQVIGPGVAAAVQGPGGAWWLFFNGFAPGDMPSTPAGTVDADHRRPFAVQLRAAVPPGRSVAQATDAELAGWLRPVSQGGVP